METFFQNTSTAIFCPAHSALYTGKGTMHFQCEVMFGSPSSNCGGNGICKIVATDRLKSNVFIRTSCNHTRAFMAPLGDGSGVSLIFRRDQLCVNLMRRYLRHGILEMPEPCPVPNGIATAIGLKMNELPAGLHLIEDYGTYLRINFKPTKII